MTPSPFTYFGLPVTRDLARIKEAVETRYRKVREYQDRPHLHDRWQEFVRCASLLTISGSFPGIYEADPVKLERLTHECAEPLLGPVRAQLSLWTTTGVAIESSQQLDLIGLAEREGIAADVAELYLRELIESSPPPLPLPESIALPELPFLPEPVAAEPAMFVQARSLIAAGRGHLEAARRTAPAADRWKDAEQASQLFAEVTEHFPTEETATSLLAEARQLLRELLTEAGDDFVRQRRPGAAIPLFERLAREPDGAAQAAARLAEITTLRTQRLDTARVEEEKGHWQEAIAILDLAEEAFPDNNEIGGRRAEIHRRAEEVQAAKEKIATLHQEGRIVALLGLLNELSRGAPHLSRLAGADDACRKQLQWAGPIVEVAEKAYAAGRLHEAQAGAERVLAHVVDHPGALDLRRRIAERGTSRDQGAELLQTAVISQRWFLARLAMDRLARAGVNLPSELTSRIQVGMTRANAFLTFLTWSLLSATILAFVAWIATKLGIDWKDRLPEQAFGARLFPRVTMAEGLTLLTFVALAMPSLLLLLVCFRCRIRKGGAVLLYTILLIDTAICLLLWSAVNHYLPTVGLKPAVVQGFTWAAGLVFVVFIGMKLGALAMMPIHRLFQFPTGFLTPIDRTALGWGALCFAFGSLGTLLPDLLHRGVFVFLLIAGLSALAGEAGRLRLSLTFLAVGLAVGLHAVLGLLSEPHAWIAGGSSIILFALFAWLSPSFRTRWSSTVWAIVRATIAVLAIGHFEPRLLLILCTWIVILGGVSGRLFQELEHRCHFLDRVRLRWKA